MLTVVSFLIAFFLKEIPLRKTHDENPLTEAGREIAVDEGNIPAKNEPKII